MPSAGGKVLIIDDEKETTEIFAKMLQLHGYNVSTAVDAEAGFQAAINTPFDAVVLDLVMPVVDGLAWLRRFRAAPSHPTTPVAIVTGHYLIENQTVHELEQLGAMVHFKPVWVDDLVAITQTLIAGNRPPGESETP